MNNINLMETFLEEIRNKKDFNEYISKEDHLKYKPFYLFPDDYFNQNLLNTLNILIKIFIYYKENNIDISFSKDLRKIILLQSIPPNKKNKPRKKLLKLNELKKEAKYWVKNSDIRINIQKSYPATLFNSKHKKYEEIGRQKILKECSLKENDEFILEDLILFTKENYFQIKQINISLSKIKEYIFFRKNVGKNENI